VGPGGHVYKEGTVTAGLLFHCHHRSLIEWTDNAEERCRWVEHNKRGDGVELRFALFTLIRLKDLPENVRKAYNNWTHPPKPFLCTEDYDPDARWRRYTDIWEETYPAWARENHKRLCHPNCPWDGKTIFAKGTSATILEKEGT
jgi:hypothetical protein